MRVVYHDGDEWFAVLRNDSTGEHFIEVESGGTSALTYRVRLTREEIRMFERGIEALRPLAAQIRLWPEKYTHRTILL
jgi:hypothetical protein